MDSVYPAYPPMAHGGASSPRSARSVPYPWSELQLGRTRLEPRLRRARLQSPAHLPPPQLINGHSFVDLRRCDGCERCAQACQNMHALAPGQKWINIYKIEDATGQVHPMPRLCVHCDNALCVHCENALCVHCENALCVKVCPVSATFKNPEGVVLVNQNLCIGCRTCMATCPYEARYFNWEEPPKPATASLMAEPMPGYPEWWPGAATA